MKIGITGYDSALDGKIDFFEIDFSSDSLKQVKSSKVLISLNQYYYRYPNPVPLRELVEKIEANVTPERTLGFSIKLTPSFFETKDLKDEVIPLVSVLEKNFSLPVYIDFPKNFSRTRKLANASIDPFWKKPSRGGFWKIHGWHDTRWVRRYSKEQLSHLREWSERYSPEILIFGHSQRSAQIAEFLSAKEVKCKKRERSL